MEVCATWAHIHFVKRLMGDEIWKKYFPGFFADGHINKQEDKAWGYVMEEYELGTI